MLFVPYVNKILCHIGSIELNAIKIKNRVHLFTVRETGVTVVVYLYKLTQQ